MLAGALLFPGSLARLDSLAVRGREAGTLALGAVLLLLVSGLLEGIVRERVTDPTARFAIGGGALLIWILWFSLAGRGKRSAA